MPQLSAVLQYSSTCSLLHASIRYENFSFFLSGTIATEKFGTICVLAGRHRLQPKFRETEMTQGSYRPKENNDGLGRVNKIQALRRVAFWPREQ
jgi:hypothetical protein